MTSVSPSGDMIIPEITDIGDEMEIMIVEFSLSEKMKTVDIICQTIFIIFLFIKIYGHRWSWVLVFIPLIAAFLIAIISTLFLFICAAYRCQTRPFTYEAYRIQTLSSILSQTTVCAHSA